MKKRIITVAALLAAFVLLMSGCDYKMLTPDQLMRPPRYYGENAELQAAFSDAAPDAVLKAPYEGEYHSAFILQDLDGDGTEEALIFYVNSMDRNICRMMLFRQDQGSWIHCATVRGEGNDVVSVTIADMAADGVQEIIVGWGISGSQERVLSVYRYTPGGTGDLRSLASETYRMMACLDLDGDNEKELFIVSATAAATVETGETSRFRARLLKLQEALQPDGTQESSITAVSELALPAAAADCTRITFQPVVDGNSPAVLLDCTMMDTGMFTDIITWTDGKLTRVMPSETENPLRYTYRTSSITCQDINSDGYVEIPTQIVLDGGVNTSAAVVNSQAYSGTSDSSTGTAVDDQVYLTVWNKLSGGRLVTVRNSIINLNDSYMFFFKDDWTSGNFPTMTNNVTVHTNIESRTCSFYDYDYSTKVRGALVFEIIVHPSGTDISMTDEQLLTEDGGLMYTVRMGSAAKSRQITYDDVVNGFVLLDS